MVCLAEDERFITAKQRFHSTDRITCASSHLHRHPIIAHTLQYMLGKWFSNISNQSVLLTFHIIKALVTVHSLGFQFSVYLGKFHSFHSSRLILLRLSSAVVFSAVINYSVYCPFMLNCAASPLAFNPFLIKTTMEGISFTTWGNEARHI